MKVSVGRTALRAAIASVTCFPLIDAVARAEGIAYSFLQIKCVADNIERYGDISTNPLTIYLDFCPKTNVTLQDLVDDLENSASVPDIPSHQASRSSSESNVSDVSNILILKKSELICIKNLVDVIVIKDNWPKIIVLSEDACEKN